MVAQLYATELSGYAFYLTSHNVMHALVTAMLDRGVSRDSLEVSRAIEK
jgi:hypothetical protein